MTTFSYPRPRAIAQVVQDVVLVAASAWLLAAQPLGRYSLLLGAAAVLVFVWQIATLHYPRSVELTDEGVHFCAYGRRHSFRWADVSECRVRKFLVGDRVLVRLLPAPRFRGRYWLLESIGNYPALVLALETHSHREPKAR